MCYSSSKKVSGLWWGSSTSLREKLMKIQIISLEGVTDEGTSESLEKYKNYGIYVTLDENVVEAQNQLDLNVPGEREINTILLQSKHGGSGITFMHNHTTLLCIQTLPASTPPNRRTGYSQGPHLHYRHTSALPSHTCITITHCQT